MHTPMAQAYNHHNHVPTPSRAPMAPTPGNAAPPVQQQHSAYNPPRPVEVYTLGGAANDAIPEDVRKAYHTDDEGRVLFFTAPPAVRRGLSKKSAGLGHSARYLEGLDEWRREREEKRRARDEQLAADGKKRRVAAEEEAARQREEEAAIDRAADVLAGYIKAHEETTKRIRTDLKLDVCG